LHGKDKLVPGKSANSSENFHEKAKNKGNSPALLIFSLNIPKSKRYETHQDRLRFSHFFIDLLYSLQKN